MALKAPPTNSAQIHPSFTVTGGILRSAQVTSRDHPGALKDGRIFDCETDVVVCSRVYGMGLAYSLNEAHVGDHCERVGAQPGMGMMLPFKLMPSSKDK